MFNVEVSCSFPLHALTLRKQTNSTTMADSDYSTNQDLRNFEQRIYNLVNEYITNEEDYSDDVQLEINTEDLTLHIADPEQDLPNCDYYPIMDLVRASEESPGEWVPDGEAITEVAAGYISVR